MQKLKHFLGMWILMGLLVGLLAGRMSQGKSQEDIQAQKRRDSRINKTSPRKPAARLIYWKDLEK